MGLGAIASLLISAGLVIMWLLYYTIKSAIKDAYKEMNNGDGIND